MSRVDAYFEGSRLYRQADEAVAAIVEDFAGDQRLFTHAMDALGESRKIHLTSPQEAIEALSRVRRKALKLASTVSAYHAIPALIQGIHESYYGAARSFGMGPSFKVAATLIWPSVFEASSSPHASHGALSLVVKCAALLDSITTAVQLLTATRGGHITIDEQGLVGDDAVEGVSKLFERAAASRGKMQRFTSESPFLAPQKMLYGVVAAIKGQDPTAIPELAGTPFALFSSGRGRKGKEKLQEFWAGILARLILLMAAYDTRRQVSDTPGGLAVLGGAGFALADLGLSRSESVVIQQALKKCFWTPNWFGDGKSLESARHWIVERPVLRIEAQSELFAMSFSNVIDSIHNFVECSVGEYSGHGGVRLPAECFRLAVSKPFEDEVAGILRGFGFEAGSVLETGSWITGDGFSCENLSGQGSVPPGEIDVLAWHPCGLVVVGECKALLLPFDARGVRNLYGKLSSDDQERFHSKLERKLRWVREALNGKRYMSGEPVGVLVLDRPVPFDSLRAPHLVVDSATLEASIAEVIEQYGQIP